MKVEYKTKLRDPDYKDELVEKYKKVVVDWCCEEAEKIDSLGFDVRSYYGQGRENPPYITFPVPEPYGQGTRQIAIDYCPFCTEPKEFEEVQRVKVVERTETVEKEVTQTEEVPVEDLETNPDADDLFSVTDDGE